MRVLNILLIAFVVVCIAACKSDKEKNVINVLTEDSLADTVMNDSTVYGRYIEGGMSTMTIENEMGDTLTFLLEDDSRSSKVHGGLYEGDKIAVIADKTTDGELFASIVINVTSLIGKWTNIAKNFEIEDGGTVRSSLQSESNPYTSWKIYNGKLLLNADTFDIYRLSPDSLSIENANGIFDYKRQR